MKIRVIRTFTRDNARIEQLNLICPTVINGEYTRSFTLYHKGLVHCEFRPAFTWIVFRVYSWSLYGYLFAETPR